jgi:hypothetical protein
MQLNVTLQILSGILALPLRHYTCLDFFFEGCAQLIL